MASKKKDTTLEAGTSTPRTRTPKVLTAAAQLLLNEAKENAAKAKAQMKEAKAIGKIIECIGTLGDWGCEKVHDALVARNKSLATETAIDATGSDAAQP